MTYDDALGPVPPRPRRDRPQLPPPLEVEPGPAIDEAHGLHDRFVIHGKGWVDRTDPDDAMRRYKARRAAWGEGGSRPLLHVDHRSPQPGVLKLTVDENSLLSGFVLIEKARGRVTARCGVTSTLHFNASRFFRYHGLRLFQPGAASAAEWLWPAGRAIGKTRSYDGNDNWVELLPEAAVAWKHGLARYIGEAERAIESELREYLAPVGTPVEVRLFGVEKVIAQAEVYWEFRADDAVEAARYYGQAAQAGTSKDVAKKAYYEHNAVSYRVHLSKRPPLALSIYAKTPDRVRFEVQYEGRISRAVPYKGEENLVQRLLLVRSDACQRLRKVLAPIVRDSSASVDARHALTALLAHISAACAGSRLDHSALLNLLISTRRLVKPVAGLPDSVLMELVRQHVIQPRSRSRTEPREHYVVAPQYQWVLERLDQAFPAYSRRRWTGQFTPGKTS